MNIARDLRRLWLSLSLSLLALGLSGLGPAPASARAPGAQRPLLVEGRSTVYQRVLTRLGAQLHPEPGAPPGPMLAPLTPFYVYDYQPGWFRIGPSIASGPTGWVPAERAVVWRQNIVAAFTNAVGRNRQILFQGEDRLRWLLEHEALRELQPEILQAAQQGDLRPEWQVVALEPAEFVDIGQQFYILPILDFVEDLHPLTYEPNLLLEVASLPLNAAQPAAPEAPAALDAGIVFVLDTTLSMDPFIERTGRALGRLVRDLERVSERTPVNFGVLSFRDNVNAVPGLVYRTNLRLRLERRSTQAPVLEAIRAATRVATVSSPGFNEDSMAGIEDAIDLMAWDDAPGGPFGARIIILITDAGPKYPRDPNARSEIGPAELQMAAEERNIAIMTLHLRTRAGGAAQHQYAEGKYRQLSRFRGSSFYYPIEGGGADAFEAAITRLLQSLIHVIDQAGSDAPMELPEDIAPEIADFGRALRLSYLGRVEGTRAPDLIRGWISERAVENPAALAVEPRLLISKAELSTLAGFMEQLLTLGEQGQTAEDAMSFFDQMRNVIARMAQDPEMLVAPDSPTLGGAIEFLEDLPYRSQLMSLTPERWGQSALGRRQILDGMRQRLALYRRWLFDPTIWVALHPEAPDPEHVFAMPFDALP